MAINRRTFVLVAVLWLAPAWAQKPVRHSTPEKSPADNALYAPEKLLQAGQFAEAEEKLQALAASRARNPQFWFDLGFAQSHQNKKEEAVDSYRKAVQFAPTWFEANLNLGLALAKSGDGAGAIPVLRHTVELKPTTGGKLALSKAWESIAEVLRSSDPKAAAQAYDKAAELNPSAPELSLNAARMLQKSGDAAQAEQRYRKSANAGNSEAMALLIDLLDQQKRYAEAEDWLHKYIAQNPKDVQAPALLAKLLGAENKPDEALAVLESAEKSSPSPAIELQLAGLYLQAKKYQQAEPLFRSLVRQNAGDSDLHYGLGLALLYQLKYPAAERELLQAVKLKPDLADAYAYLSDAARENKHYPLAIQALDARARFLPETPATIFTRAICYDNLRMTKQAVASYKQFLTVAGGKYPDQEFQARHRLKAIEPE
ncbi:MAG TPA: tetratricopeptide repeat protein [Terriglobales bacterium]|nr:tetratricopeptide repeat protein [Terriglobales bacterium]